MSNATDPARLSAYVYGHVQGVGFRWWVSRQAQELQLQGVAANLPDGRVHVVAEGNYAALQELLARLKYEEEGKQYRRPGHVDMVNAQWESARGVRGFETR